LGNEYTDPRHRSDVNSEEGLKELSDSGKLNLRKAYVSDVEEILTLINDCASSNLMLARGPRYLYENIRDFAVVEVIGEGAEPKIIACGSLHMLWKDIAEIRSLATHPQFRRRGLGLQIVRYFIEEARQMGIETVFAFTLEAEFFKKLGFKPKKKGELPSKVWGECIQCPKYFHCDETGLIFDCTK
jgi:amino-acid N-acetyltransferase